MFLWLLHAMQGKKADEGAYEVCFTKRLNITNFMQPIWGVVHVVPMEITFMDNGGSIFVLCEFVDYMNSHIIRSHTNQFTLDEFIWNPYRFLISSLGSPTFFLRIAKRER
jgi:hypothetical protein